MPLYNFMCKECDVTFDVRRSFSQAKVLPECPSCESEDTKKLLARINIGGTAVFNSGALARGKIPLSMSGGCCGAGGGCGCHGRVTP